MQSHDFGPGSPLRTASFTTASATSIEAAEAKAQIDAIKETTAALTKFLREKDDGSFLLNSENAAAQLRATGAQAFHLAVLPELKPIDRLLSQKNLDTYDGIVLREITSALGGDITKLSNTTIATFNFANCDVVFIFSADGTLAHPVFMKANHSMVEQNFAPLKEVSASTVSNLTQILTFLHEEVKKS